MVDEKEISTEEQVATGDDQSRTSTEISETKKPAIPAAKKAAAKKKPTKKKPRKKNVAAKKAVKRTSHTTKFPRHTLARVLRFPSAILEQNAGRDTTDKEACGFVGVTLNGDRRVEISSAIKYGILDRPSQGRLSVTDLARRILRPQQSGEKRAATRQAILSAPDISDVYQHYRGENLPDDQFFDNALVDSFNLPQENISQFKSVFLENLRDAELVEEHNGKWRLLDVSSDASIPQPKIDTFAKLEKSVSVNTTDTCFVIMPFAEPLGTHYSLIFEPAIEKAGLKPMRADNDIFATGKIMDQVWRGLTNAKVLVAELTSRNPNVFYELGLAHAMKKPVVLISASEDDVPFDVRHIRVIYYDVNDPFWGEKLMKKVSENILSALKNPEEAIFQGPDV